MTSLLFWTDIKERSQSKDVERSFAASSSAKLISRNCQVLMVCPSGDPVPGGVHIHKLL